MNDEIFYEIAIKSLTNESSEKEEIQLKQYLLHPEYQTKYNALSDVFKNHPAEVFQEFNLNRGIKRLRHKIKQAKSESFFLNTKIMGIAASLLVLLGLGMLFKSNVFTTKPINYVSVVSMAGQRTKILLPDSSIVHLNSGATIRYPEKFVGNRRDVELKGEAFFKIKRNVDKPFTVNSGNFKTTVLGTSFSVANNAHNDFQVV